MTSLRSLFVAIVAAVSLAGPVSGSGAVAAAPAAPAAPTAPAAPQALSRSCTVDGVTWRVDYTLWADSGFGPLLKVDDMDRIEGGVETEAVGLTWEWRLDLLPAQWPPAGTNPWLFLRAARGPLKAGSATQWFGAEWQSFQYSPRLVTPDGTCQIYLMPFANKQAQATWPAVAVLGDSLLQSLNDSTANLTHAQGFVEAHFNTHGVRAEVEGQGGRSWTTTTPAGLPRADSYLLDEFRGLADHDPAGIVVALGANDAIGLAMKPADQRAAARTVVHDDLIAQLVEMAASSDCVVAVTAVEHPINLGAIVSGADYATEATGINNILRFMAAIDPTDALHVQEFATQAALHQYGGAGSWFGTDNLHLNDTGRIVYTDTMWQAADKCV